MSTETVELLQDFLQEARESLHEASQQIEQFFAASEQTEAIHAVFRAVHSIKGAAGFFGLLGVKNFSHRLENVLDQLRSGQLAPDPRLGEVLVRGIDLLDDALQQAEEGEARQELSTEEQALLEELEGLAKELGSVPDPQAQLAQVAQLLRQISEQIGQWSVPEAPQVAGQLQQLADSLAPPQEDSPPSQQQETECSEQLLAESSYASPQGADLTEPLRPLAEFFLKWKRGEYTDQLGETFLQQMEQAAGALEKHHLADEAARLQNAAADFRTILQSPLDLDDNLVSIIWEPVQAVLAGLRHQQATQESSSPGKETRQGADSKPAAPSARPQPGSGESQRIVRVREDYLDEFLESVSELFITCERYKDVQKRMAETDQLPALVDELREINSSFVQQSNDLQQKVLTLRRIPAGTLLSKFPKLARGLANQLGKKVRVHLIGEDMPVDKQTLEALDAPLTHMVRNAVDHGIQPPEERAALGLPEQGNIWLEIQQTPKEVILEIRDDGRGIDPEKLRAKAVERGILTPRQAEALSDQEAQELIFHPGFSTAEKVSDVSGRGVGMDVVLTTVRQRGGEITLHSEVGRGSTFRITIPIQQGVLVKDALMLSWAGQPFALPFEHVVEIAEVPRSQLVHMQTQWVVTLREQTHAVIPLGQALGIQAKELKHQQAIPLVLIRSIKGSLCLAVERILGHRQVVVNPLGDWFCQVRGIAGVTQLGGGKLALVLGAEEIINTALSQESSTEATP